MYSYSPFHNLAIQPTRLSNHLTSVTVRSVNVYAQCELDLEEGRELSHPHYRPSVKIIQPLLSQLQNESREFQTTKVSSV